jgi:hypothetical protein
MLMIPSNFIYMDLALSERYWIQLFMKFKLLSNYILHLYNIYAVETVVLYFNF